MSPIVSNKTVVNPAVVTLLEVLCALHGRGVVVGLIQQDDVVCIAVLLIWQLGTLRCASNKGVVCIADRSFQQECGAHC